MCRGKVVSFQKLCTSCINKKGKKLVYRSRWVSHQAIIFTPLFATPILATGRHNLTSLTKVKSWAQVAATPYQEIHHQAPGCNCSGWHVARALGLLAWPHLQQIRQHWPGQSEDPAQWQRGERWGVSDCGQDSFGGQDEIRNPPDAYTGRSKEWTGNSWCSSSCLFSTLSLSLIFPNYIDTETIYLTADFFHSQNPNTFIVFVCFVHLLREKKHPD